MGDAGALVGIGVLADKVRGAVGSYGQDVVNEGAGEVEWVHGGEGAGQELSGVGVEDGMGVGGAEAQRLASVGRKVVGRDGGRKPVGDDIASETGDDKRGSEEETHGAGRQTRRAPSIKRGDLAVLRYLFRSSIQDKNGF